MSCTMKYILVIPFLMCHVVLSTGITMRPSTGSGRKPAIPGVLPDISPQRYVVYTTSDTIKRVNLDNPDDVVESSRPEPGNLHVDVKSMMLYYSTFDGEKIMKQPFNFDATGIYSFLLHFC